MRIHRIHTRQALQPGQAVTLEESVAHYLGRVLRVVEGQTVVLFNGDGYEYTAAVGHAGRRQLVLLVSDRLPGLAESTLELVVVQALSRGERMDQTLQKCTELGAAAFQLLVSERSGLKLAGEKLDRRLEHWRGVIISACEQCGRARVPPLRAPLTLPDWLERELDGCRVVLDPNAATPLAGARLAKRVELAVGPEGGFDEREVALMHARGVQAVSLGPRVLRTETAAPAAVAILQCLRGDLGPFVASRPDG